MQVPRANCISYRQAHLLTVWTGTLSGMPASKPAMRTWMARCELSPSTLPITMSPMSCARCQELRDIPSICLEALKR